MSTLGNQDTVRMPAIPRTTMPRATHDFQNGCAFGFALATLIFTIGTAITLWVVL